MKIVLDEIPVWTFRAICLTVGGQFDFDFGGDVPADNAFEFV